MFTRIGALLLLFWSLGRLSGFIMTFNTDCHLETKLTETQCRLNPFCSVEVWKLERHRRGLK